jgi:RNA polymerase sigma factor (sigma-70 family)
MPDLLLMDGHSRRFCGRVEKDVEQAAVGMPDELSPDAAFVGRRAALARAYQELPTYGSDQFWQVIEGRQTNARPPSMEVLVRVLREAVAREDEATLRRFFEVVIARLQASNEWWIAQAIAHLHLHPDEQYTLAADLYADLCEALLRVLRDPRRHFWEENFQHSLYFVRKSVYEDFLRREGRWIKQTPGPGYRVPRMLLESLERIGSTPEEEEALAIFDERAEQELQAVEQADIAALVLRLPERLRLVVWLIFWDDCTVKTVSELLKISTRTVHNRLRDALELLRKMLEAEQEVIDGRSA